MENLIGHRQHDVQRKIYSALKSLEQAKEEVAILVSKNGHGSRRRRQQLKAKVANNLHQLERAIATADRQNMEEIDTEDLRAKIIAYEAHFAKTFPNKAIMPEKTTRAKHQFFNRGATYTTPCWRMGPPK